MARSSKKTTKKKSGKIGLDFTGVETRVLLPENDYLLSVASLEEEDESVIVGIKVEKGKFEGKVVKEYFSTKPQALWRFGNFIAACGLEVPNGEIELDVSDFEGVTVMGCCVHEEYEGKTKMRWDFYGADEDDAASDDDDEEDEKETKSSKGKSAKKDTKSTKGKSKKDEPAEDEAGDKVSKEDVEAMDRDELGDLIDEHGLEVDVNDKKLKKDEKLLAAVLAALEENDLLEDEEADEPEPEPKGKKGKAAKGGKKKGKDKIAASDVEDMDEDELQACIDENELEDVDLDDHKTLRKKVRAVLDALEAADLLEE